MFLTACAGVKHKNNLTYNADIGYSGTFDYYEPKLGNSKNRPAIIAIHGGAWQIGDKSWGEQVAEEFTSRGYVVFSINYRHAPDHRWPAQLEDVTAAYNYFKGTAAVWKINPDRITAFGISAGGHLAAHLGLREGIPFMTANGESDLVTIRDQDHNLEKVLGPRPWSTELLKDFSPVEFITSEAQALIIHSTGDYDVDYQHAVRFHQLLSAANADVTFVAIHDNCHNKCWKDALPEMRSFLRRVN